VSLPVVIKGGRQSEKTLTANVSAHGISVFSERELPLRQYVELEITLPNGSNINATAMVVRNEEALADRAGLTHPGIAFDFHLLDAIGRAAWWAYIAQLRGDAPTPSSESEDARMPGLQSANETLGYTGPEPMPPAAPQPAPVVMGEPERLPSDALRPLPGSKSRRSRPVSFGAPTVSPAPSAAPTTRETDDEPPAAFIIKPRDQGRLWAFFRGELAQGRVKIESPVVRPVGSPVELLVVHPKTDEEWSLWGEVFAVRPRGRGNDPMLEIRMAKQTEAVIERFRRFIATGGQDRRPDEDELVRQSEESPIKHVPQLMPDDPEAATTEAPMLDETEDPTPPPLPRNRPKKATKKTSSAPPSRRRADKAAPRPATFAAFFDEFGTNADEPRPAPSVTPKARLDDDEETSPADEF